MKNNELLASLAQDYYVAQLSRSELTEKYKLSRYLVNKYLDEARSAGIVSFSIATPIQRNIQLEHKLQMLFDIPNIFIVKDTAGLSDSTKMIIQFAAEQIVERISASHIVGMLWGDTVFDIIDCFPPSTLENLTFTQFMGENRKYNSQAGSMRMVEKAAHKFNASYLTLSGPLYIADKNTRQGMLNEFSTQPALSAAQNMDLLFTGLGTLASINSISDWRENTDKIFPDVPLDHVAGMIYGRPYDINGHLLNKEQDCTFGIDMKTILATPHRVGVVKSKFKTEATLGALRGRFFTELIITENIALRLLDYLGV